MQPLPSGLPPTLPLPPPPPPPPPPSQSSNQPPPQSSNQPPPPPPPRLPIAAFTSAATTASLYPPSRRRPTLHIIVVLGSATVPILRHAHHALCTLSAKGVHVFLQTETERVGTRTVTPITPDVVPDVITACRADFIVLIADRNVPSRTVQVRLSPTAEFVDVPLSDLPEAVLAAWTQQLRTVPDRLQQISLAFNPNVVTSAHLDLLLHSYSGVSSIRRSYANLARLVNVTQDWVHMHNSETETKVQARETETPTNAESAAKSEEPSGAEGENSDSIPDTLTLKALRDGLRRISGTETEQRTSEQEQNPNSDITFCWLKRSDSMSARLMRSQLLARDLHQKLVESVDVISGLPLAPSPLTAFSGRHLPTEAHRQRLLREINDIIPRIEELGKRLSKRPRTPRRRRQFHGANPWMSYVSQSSLYGENKGVSRWAGKDGQNSEIDLWCCFSCRTLNESQLQECTVCEACNHTLNTTSRPPNADVFQKQLQENMNNTTGMPSPWIFAPGAMSMQPPINTSPVNGIVRRDHGKLEAATNTFLNDEAMRQSMNEAPFGSPPLHDVNQSKFQQVERGNAVQSLSFEDGYNGFAPDTKQATKGTGDHRNTYRQPSPSHPNQTRQSASSSTSNTVSPVRMASSAPNGRSPIEFTSQRLPNGIRGTASPQMTLSQQRVVHSSQRVHASAEHESVQPGPSSMMVGSFPGANMFSTNISYEASSVNSQNDAHPQNLFRPSDVASSGVSMDHAATPAKTALNSPMEELAFGSFEAVEPRNRLTGNSRRAVSNSIAVSGSLSGDETLQSGITSLRALAAASDAAKGGTGSATQESLRAVSAVVTPNRGQSGKQSRAKGAPNGTYNMF